MRRKALRPIVRVPLIAALIAFSLWVVYLLAGNAVLFTGWLEQRVSKSPEKRLLEFSSAWTIWPGRVHVRDFRLRHADDDLQLEIRIPRATLDIELGSLARQKLLVQRIDADGLSFRFRRLLDDAEAQGMRARALPRIEGLPELPLEGCEPPEPRKPSAGGNKWDLEIRGIDARVSEIWVDELKYAGRGRVRGAFRLLPGRELELRDSRVELGPGQLGFGELRTIASKIQGSARGQIERLDLSSDARHGWRIFRLISLNGTLAARVEDLGFASAYFPEADLDLAGGGELSVALDVERGRFSQNSRVEYRSPRVELRTGRVAARGDLALLLDVIAEGAKTRGRIRVAGDRIELTTKQHERPATLSGLKLELYASNVDLSKKWRAHSGALRLAAVSVPDLTLLNAVKNGGDWKLLGGTLHASAHAVLDRRGRVNGQLEVEADRARVRVGELGLSASGSIKAGVYQPSLRSARGELRDASVELGRFSFATDSGSSGPGSLTARSARIDYRAFKPLEFDLHFASAFDSAEGVLDALDVAQSGVPRIARLFTDLEDLRVAGSVRYESGKLVVEIDRARTDGVETRGYVERDSEQRGRFEIDLGLFDFETRVGGRTKSGISNGSRR